MTDDLSVTNPTGGSGFHLVTSAAADRLAVIKTDKLAGHQLKITAYGNSDPGQNVQLYINDTPVTAPVIPQSAAFVFDAILVIDASENRAIAQLDSPITDTNVRQTVTQFRPLPENIVFSLKGTSSVHGFQVWKLGIRN